MKNIIIGMIALCAGMISAGESVDIIENLKANTKEYSFKREISTQGFEDWNRSIKNAALFIQKSDPKLYVKFMDLQTASNTLINTIKIIYGGYILPFKKQLEKDPFDMIVDRKMVNDMEKIVQPLHAELKKIKGSVFSGISLFKKSESQKVFNVVKDILIQRLQEIIDEFKEFKKNPIIN